MNPTTDPTPTTTVPAAGKDAAPTSPSRTVGHACPRCGAGTHVTRCRRNATGITRWRKCQSCGWKFNTEERIREAIDATPPDRRKAGRKTPSGAEKLKRPDPVNILAEAARLKNAGDLPGAVATLKAALAQSPDDTTIHSALALSLPHLADSDAAIKHAQRVCELTPHDPLAFTVLSVTYVRCGRNAEAEAAKQRADELRMLRPSG